MRPFESVILLLCLLLPFVLLSERVRRAGRLLWLLPAAALLAHGIFESFRWQLAPPYLLLTVISFLLFRSASFFGSSWIRRVTMGLLLFATVGTSFFLAAALPVFELPPPGGTFPVGARYVHLRTDADEPLTTAPDDKRELMVKVWYPAAPQAELREPYLDAGDRRGFALKYGLPKGAFNYLDAVKTNTYAAPAVAEGRFPVLLFSHGQYAQASGYYALLEAVAAQGFIIIGINHTHESVGTAFPDGRITYFNHEYDRSHNDSTMAAMAWEMQEDYRRAETTDARRGAVVDKLNTYYGAEVTLRWARDFGLVADRLPEWSRGGFLAGHVLPDRVGVFGHSQGGAAAGQALLDDDRFAAGVNLDGVQWGPMVDTFLTKPFLLVFSDWDTDHPNANQFAYERRGPAPFYAARIAGTGHASFMDIPFIVNLPSLNESGSIDPARAANISATAVVTFFDQYLRDGTAGLEKLPGRFPELRLEVR